MKLSFWTMGMPRWPISEFAQRAKEYGYDGIDLRCTEPEYGEPSNLGDLCIESSDEKLDEIRQAFTQAGVQISSLLCYNLGARLGASKTEWDAVEAELVAQARVADKLGCKVIRVKAADPRHRLKWNWDGYLADLGQASLRAVKETPNVSAIFENHVGQANSDQIFRMVESIGDARLGVLFSAEHSVVMQENPVELVDRHWAAIRQVSFADRKVVEEELGRPDGRYYYVKYEACRIGEGAVPVRKILDTLTRRGYDGYLTLKWEKTLVGGHYLPSGEEELQRFAEYMRSLGVGKVKA